MNSEVVVRNYLALVDKLEHTEHVLVKYPVLVYPESLLPHPKKDIQQALEHARKESNHLVTIKIERGLEYLKSFIPDKEAEERNIAILEDPDYWKRLAELDLLP